MGAKRVLIVSPHFPPVNAPDMQRVRMSLPYFEQFGWTPCVLAVAPTGTDVVDPLLSGNVPSNISVDRVRTLPSSLTRFFGIGNLALRALPFLYAEGCRLIEQHDIDLVFFSTTMFFTMPLGRLWKRKFGVPYVLDFQDPWVTDYYETHPNAQPPAKYGVSRRLHAILEPWTLKMADGLLAVSPDYIETLHTRYDQVKSVPSATLPFGASQIDFNTIDEHPQNNRHFAPDGQTHGVYVGVVGDVMSTAATILLRALKLGLAAAPELFTRVLLHFIGTDYASDGRARKTVEPIAARVGVAKHVTEDTARVPYFQALQLLKDADFLLVIGSDDPGYTASKIYPYIMARKPLLAIVHEKSTVVTVVNHTRAGIVLTFPTSPGPEELDALAIRLTERWTELLRALPYQPNTDWNQFEPYTAREMTKSQCELFDRVVARRAMAA